MKRVLNVCVTGAAGNVAYPLYCMLCSGQAFGQGVDLNLRLLQLEEKMNRLKALKFELEDCCYSNVFKIQIYSNDAEAFQDADVVIFLGGMLRKPGMDRHQFYKMNADIFMKHGQSLNVYAKKNCKSLVVANPPNSNCTVLARNAPSIPIENFTCLTRLSYNRFESQIARTFNCQTKSINNLIVWGSSFKNQFYDADHLKIDHLSQQQVFEKLNTINLQDIANEINSRRIFIIDTTGGSCFMSAAKSIIDHLHDWFLGSQKVVSMGVILAQEKYGIPAGYCSSMPNICLGEGKYKIVDDLELKEIQKMKILQCKEELQKQRILVEEYFSNQIQSQ